MTDVFVRRVMRADAPDLIRANIDNRDYHAPWVNPFIDQGGFDSWFAGLVTGPDVGLLARHDFTGEIVGVFRFSQIVMGAFCSAYLGYYGMRAHARTGRMARALRLVLEYGFDELGLHRVEANIQPGNMASIALVRRAGFRREGFSPRYLKIDGAWRDHERWACLADDR
ncbi:GCN5-related N-acetyltransferase [Gluconacetobacter diazotrophicus PA1 5]|uniref:GNAT family N-acetyltransferase n=2 Tax=Gluconacetobacter diazotrophicus TaxID=33996 RepID=A0A7W4I550_GLUDI|nr:GNAT family protein [Gluconacetobacter diazotrophicus]ACI50978.1 GCN5-related N-acetyltransferase [Gluconacetobacter diazotrophicus PA1 5]MBB2156677.1 GNAT family N-acetyltransferase [Gluconacetobacter diazotrophicus]TWB08567.1 ribosomal-protein-alanine N-acetyltransferase [Gluconacetobacter diazotrophicus]CAP54765.1 putative ribosomal-protein-alanine acetyltransferase [Gluconacetobacter diazotrophicus PA1 5]